VIEAVPKHWFSSSFIVTEDSVAITDISLTLREDAFVVGGLAYRVERDDSVKGALTLRSPAAVLARAQPEGPLGVYAVEHEGRHYVLRAQFPSARPTFALLDASHRQIGSFSPKGILGRRMSGDVSEDIPPPLRIFLIWLVLFVSQDLQSQGG
jgi:hypothetical protein